MTPIPCVFYEKLPFIRRYLRRFIMSAELGPCTSPDCTYCNALVWLDDIDPVLTEDGCIPAYQHDRTDPRWPRNCEHCGRAFPQDIEDHATAPWQVFADWLYMNTENKQTVPNREMPVGAMWYQQFGHGPHSRYLLARHGLPLEFAGKKLGEINGVRPPHLFVRTPGGVFDMDTTATNGDGWEVTGEPPFITASPSIQHTTGNQWHGWLRNGVLTQC